jgi:hypothetical protein
LRGIARKPFIHLGNGDKSQPTGVRNAAPVFQEARLPPH